MSTRVFGSEYMNWAKTSSRAKFNLATSGLANMRLDQLEITFEDLEITSEYGYGYPPLMRALSARMVVEVDSIVTAAGTSFANHLAMAALVGPGDEVLMEQPTYDPLLSLARYLGVNVKRFPRRFEDGFQIDMEALQKTLSSRTKLIVLTNLHNPTGVQLDEQTLKSICETARTVGSRILIDEVYLETFFENRPPTAFHLGPEFITTTSLTKAFGLSGLRCGWIVAERELTRRMWLLNDLFASTPVHAGERMSVQALRQLDRIGTAAKSLLQKNRQTVNRFLDSRSDLEAVRPDHGTIVFPRLKRGNADQFCQLLKEKYETSVVPGRFFEEPQHFRLGMGGDSATLDAGLERIGQALDELS